jgi:hypothetical protein
LCKHIGRRRRIFTGYLEKKVASPFFGQRYSRHFRSSKSMPYFVFRIHDPKHLEYLDTKTKYQEAKALVRRLRAEQPGSDPAAIRLIYAKTQAEAEKLLSTPRDDRVIGED